MSPFTFGSPASSVNVKTCDPVIGKEPVFGFKLTLKECEPASPLPIEPALPEKPSSALTLTQEQPASYLNDDSFFKLRMLSPRNQTLPPIMKAIKPADFKFLVYMKSPEGQFEQRFVEIMGNDLYVSKQGKKPTFVNCLKGCYTQIQRNYSLRIPGDD
jgi:hypothetical protein